jgi:hypothetical protein
MNWRKNRGNSGKIARAHPWAIAAEREVKMPLPAGIGIPAHVAVAIAYIGHDRIFSGGEQHQLCTTRWREETQISERVLKRRI